MNKASVTVQINGVLIGIWAILGALVTAVNLPVVQSVEKQVQTLFFELRGTVSPPEDIVILAMDEESLQAAQFFDSGQVPAELQLIEQWPWRREAYAIAIARLMAANAQAVALDVIFDRPSTYGVEDDQRLKQVLERYHQRVAIAFVYEDSVTSGGVMWRKVEPHPNVMPESALIGFTNYVPELNGGIYRLAHYYTQNCRDQVNCLFAEPMGEPPLSFAEATLKAAQIAYPQPHGSGIFFYGPPRTFTIIPFAHVLDQKNWQGYLQNGRFFQDKIVLIGPMAEMFKDFHKTPFSQTRLHPSPMTGIEVHANSIATLIENRSLMSWFPNPHGRGLFVGLALGLIGVFLIKFPKQPHQQLWGGFMISGVWFVTGYSTFTLLQSIIPTAVPIGAILLSSCSLFIVGAISDRWEKIKVRRALERYVAAPIASEILKQPGGYQSLQKGRRISTAVLFSDIRNFTTLSTQLEPEELVEQLNQYLDAMVEPILAVGGTLDKFIGDAIMAEFGSPVSQGTKTDALNAIKAALGMRKNLVILREQWRKQGKQPLFNGIGINYGEAIAGDIGSVKRREYAVIGDTVNVASRVEGLTKNFGTDILITESLYELVAEDVDAIALEPQRVKGRAEAVKLYILIGLKGESQDLFFQIREDFHHHLYQE